MSCKDVPIRCNSPARYISPFWGFTAFTPTIPKLYWNVKSQEQRILRICDLLDKLICYSDYLGDNVDVNREEIEALKSEFEEFKESGFDDYYLEQVEKWMNDNAATLFTLLAKMVFFGLTDDGHFVAYIPESWDDLMFDTGFDYSNDLYGRLILRWDVDEQYPATQTPYEANSYGRY